MMFSRYLVSFRATFVPGFVLGVWVTTYIKHLSLHSMAHSLPITYKLKLLSLHSHCTPPFQITDFSIRRLGAQFAFTLVQMGGEGSGKPMNSFHFAAVCHYWFETLPLLVRSTTALSIHPSLPSTHHCPLPLAASFFPVWWSIVCDACAASGACREKLYEKSARNQTKQNHFRVKGVSDGLEKKCCCVSLTRVGFANKWKAPAL